MRAAFALLALLAIASGTHAADAVPACPASTDAMDGWNTRAPPRKIFGNTYYVGTCGISAILVTGKRGHVLIDGATEPAGPLIAANIEALGFKLKDVKFIVNSHEHFDHAAGIAHLQRATGATVLAREPALAMLRSGHSDRHDPQFLELPPSPPVANVKPLAGGQTVRVGQLALTAHATPGHAPGGTSWTWRSCEGTRCLDFAYADSVSAISDKQYRYTDHPDYVVAFRKGLDTMASLPCDVLLAPHPLGSNLFARMEGTAPLTEAGACKRYAETGRNNLRNRLQAEQDGKAP
ncbi:MAG: subclass B3 metallo-beta-lactamase [Pseudoxanthomonas sp.]